MEVIMLFESPCILICIIFHIIYTILCVIDIPKSVRTKRHNQNKSNRLTFYICKIWKCQYHTYTENIYTIIVIKCIHN